MNKIIALIFIILSILPYQANAQKSKSISIKINQTKPSVYITYDRRGKLKPLFQGESENRIWLKMHNNTKLNIFFCAFSVSKEYGEIGLYHTVKRISLFNKEMPLGYGQSDACDVSTLGAGKSVLFSLPSEHLDKDLAIKIESFYGWTGDWKQDMYEGTTHLVAFGNDQITK
jgi:hypothetical protein